MVGLVLVSHSRALAEALKALVGQVVVGEIPIAIAAGTGPDRDLFGTDAVEIMDAIQSVYSPDGVLVLMDLGSAVMSAEMALELLPEEMSQHIRVCAAPIVEGAIAASVQISLGSSLESACAEAASALLPKFDHIAQIKPPIPTPEAVPTTESEVPTQPGEQTVLTLKNLHGLHARPAARFVQTAAQFDADVQVKNLTNGKGPVSARSLNGVATLGAVRDHQVQITASGSQAAEVIQALQALVADNFGEEPDTASAMTLPAASQRLEKTGRPIPISEGIALGPLWRLQVQAPEIPTEPAENVDQEWQRLNAALDSARQQTRQRRQKLAASLGKAEAEIFDAHLLILQDPELLKAARAAIFDQHQNAAAAWDAAIRSAAADYQALDDEYLQQRAADVLDVGKQVLIALSGKASTPVIGWASPVILFANELTPTETSQLEMDKVIGVITASGGPTSHSAILSRALGIPAVSGVTSLEQVVEGTLVAMDGFNGEVWVEPAPQLQQELQQRRQEWLNQRQQLLALSASQATTRDGRRIIVAANVGEAKDAEAALKNSAEGIGLLRTEFLYLTRETPPSEAEQIDSLRKIGAALAADGNSERSIIVRTMDVGGDKALPYLPLPHEDNPFLGVRAIRLSLRNPDLFRIQLRAVLRAAYGYQFRIMFPMVANLDEVLAARELLAQVHQELETEGLTHTWPVETGIMVEVPAAAVTSPMLAEHVDFFSIGTNDLTQYTLAAERGNAALAEMNDALHPAVLKLIEQVAAASHDQGKWTGVCGELASDPVAIPVLVGLGVDELSMNPGAIPLAKAILRELDMQAMQAIARQAVAAQSAPQARQLAQDFLATHTTITLAGRS